MIIVLFLRPKHLFSVQLKRPTDKRLFYCAVKPTIRFVIDAHLNSAELGEGGRKRQARRERGEILGKDNTRGDARTQGRARQSARPHTGARSPIYGLIR